MRPPQLRTVHIGEDIVHLPGQHFEVHYLGIFFTCETTGLQADGTAEHNSTWWGKPTALGNFRRSATALDTHFDLTNSKSWKEDTSERVCEGEGGGGGMVHVKNRDSRTRG